MNELLNKIKKNRSPESNIIDMIEGGLEEYTIDNRDDIIYYGTSNIILFIKHKSMDFYYNVDYMYGLFNITQLDYKTKEIIYDIIVRYKSELNISNALIQPLYKSRLFWETLISKGIKIN